jgi:O-antigen/teichoic acid export membrane protein
VSRIGLTLRRAAADGTVTMMTCTVVAGLAIYAWQAAGTRKLGSVAFAPVATTWTITFLITTILLAPIEQFATRTVAGADDGRAQLAHATRTISILISGATLAIGIITFVLRHSLFRGSAGYALICLAIVPCFAQLLFVRGILGGERDFAGYGRLSVAEALTRLVVGLPLVLLGGSALAFAWTIPACTLVAFYWAGHWPTREETRREVAPGVPVGPFLATTVGGSSAAQLILAGGPLLLALLNAPAQAITVFFVTQTVMRGAFLIATPAWARTLPPLTEVALRQEHRRLSQLAELLLASSVLLAVICGAAAAVVGPPVVAALFGQGSRPDALLSALLAVGTVLAIGNLGLNQLLVAAVRTKWIMVSWWTALCVNLAWVGLGPGVALHRVAVGFVIGELVAMVALTVASSPGLAPAQVVLLIRRLRAARTISQP